jgi:hypothetical protein
MPHHVEQKVLVLIERLTAKDFAPISGFAVEKAANDAGLSLDEATLTKVLLKLREGGLITCRFLMGSGVAGFAEISVTRSGHREAAADTGDPFDITYGAARTMLASVAFAEAFPGAFEPWAEAQRLLAGTEPQKHLTTIGHNAREAAQGFATAMIQRFGADAEPDADVKHVKARLGSVIAAHRKALGPKRRKVLEDLGTLWSSSVDLIERQEHGAQKEGETVTTDDARRIVYLTMFLMTEFATIFESVEQQALLCTEP